LGIKYLCLRDHQNQNLYLIDMLRFIVLFALLIMALPPIQGQQLLVFGPEMPHFPGEWGLPPAQTYQKSQEAFEQFIIKGFELPDSLQQIDLQDKVKVRFIIGLNGEMEELELVNDPGDELSQAVLAAFQRFQASPLLFTPDRSRMGRRRFLVTKEVRLSKTGDEVAIQLYDEMEETYKVIDLPLLLPDGREDRWTYLCYDIRKKGEERKIWVTRWGAVKGEFVGISEEDRIKGFRETADGLELVYRE
jgi:hypothetical protein